MSMWSAVAKFVGGKVLTAVLVVASAVTLLWFWRHPEHLADLWRVVRAALVWLGFAVVLPWVSFFVLPWLRKFENNVAPALLLLVFLLLDVCVALYLAGWDAGGALGWIVLILGAITAAVYNFVVCDYLARQMDDAQGL